MQTNLRLFMILAKELNFHRAAKRAFISQQGLSDHIKRLEEHYGVKLFRRKPITELTDSGKALYRFACRLEMLEAGFYKEIDEMKSGEVGCLRVGFNAARGRIILPKVLEQFHILYPKVQVITTINESQLLEEMLLENKLDGLLGLNIPTRKEFLHTSIYEEKIHLVCSEKYIKTFLSEDVESVICEFNKGVKLEKLLNAPFAQDLSYGKLRLLIEQYLNANNIVLNTTIETEENDLRMELCAKGLVASFFPTWSCDIAKQNELLPSNEKLHSFELYNFPHSVKVDWVCNKESYLPMFVNKFMSIVKEECELHMNKMQSQLSK